MYKIRHKILLIFCLTASLLLLSLTATTAPVAVAKQQALSEYEVKVAYILNFIKFSTWPENAFKDNQQDIVLGILGEDYFGDTLAAIDGQYIKNRHLQVIHLSRTDSPHGCHLLFIASSEHRHLKQILSGIQTEPILTISDIDNFAKDGGMIQIKKTSNKIKLFINANATTKARIQLRANLLKIATLVGQ
ncbi:MAG: YfiR family protein [Desulfobulbaceae bacterium]|nr:YfiR family protein [Desulfobulbaceae bacterium]